MTDTPDASDTAPVAGAHRLIRALRADEGPYSGALITDGDAVRVWVVDPDAYDERFLGAEHVCAPVGFARHGSGSGALLPWCTVRAGAFLARRTTAGEPLSAGEWVTLMASLLRGLGEAAQHAAGEPTGTWWLTDEGRPVLVPGGARPARAAAHEIIKRAADEASERGLVRLADALAEDLVDALPPQARLERWEEELCAFAAPRPLRMDVHPPERAVDIAAPLRTSDPPRMRVRDRRRFAESAVTRCLAVVRALMPSARRVRDGGAAEGEEQGRLGRRSPAGHRAAEEAPPRPPRRSRVVAVAAAAAGAVVVMGMLWPDGNAAEAEDVRDPSGPALSTTAPRADDGADDGSDADASPDVDAHADAPPDTDDGPLTAVPGLLTALDECASDDAAECPALASGAGTDAASVRRAEEVDEWLLIDDFGDLAVVRLSGAETDQMLVLVRQDEKWLVRDAYDVADQP